MNLRYPLLLLGFLCFFQYSLIGQCPSNSFQHLDVNQVKAQFNNSAESFWDLTGLGVYEVPKGGGSGTAFAGSIWLGGLNPQGQLHVSASTYRQAGENTFLAGPYRRPAQPACSFTFEAGGDICEKGLKRLSNGKVLALHTDGIEIYDPSNGQTISRAFLQVRSKLDAIELTDGRVLIYGDDNYPNKNPLLILDTLNYTLTTGPTLVWVHQESRAVQLDSGKVLFAGVIGCELFDPLTNTSAAVPDMLYPRMHFAMAKLDNGDVMAFGGGSTLSGTGNSPSGQRFDDSLGYWFPAPTMSVGRNRPEMTPLDDGTFLISGRNGGGSTVTEIFDPQTMTLSIGPALPFVVNFHSLVLQDNGDLFIARGTEFNDGPSLFNFTPSTGAWESINIQRTGTNLVKLDGDEILVNVEGKRLVERMDFKTGIQSSSRWQYVWKVSRAEIDQFRADYMAGTIDFANYPNIETWPAHGDVGAGEDRNLAPFIDVNMDGNYRPEEDGDYPCIAGDQAVWYVFNDQGEHINSQTPGMGLQVEVMAYSFDCSQTQCPDSSLDYATFMHYEITNHSDTTWSDVHIGNLQDADLGNWNDDFVGCDSALSLGFIYNGDNDDFGEGGYGLNPPAWGSAILPNLDIDRMTSYMVYNNDFDSVSGNPSTGAHYYNLMQSKWLNGAQAVANGNDGNPYSSPGPATQYMYPSTEGFCGGFLTGWSEISAAHTPFDRKYLQSFGPFTFPAGESIQLDLTFPYARGNSNTESVCELKDATAAIQAFWQNQMDRSCFDIMVGIEEEEFANSSLELWPNPSDGKFKLGLPSPIINDGKVQVYALSGEMIFERIIPAGEQEWVLDGSEWAKGMYVVQMLHDGQLDNIRLVLQ